MAIQLIKSAYTKEFESCFDKFILENPIVAYRASARLCIALSTLVKNALPHFVAKRSNNFVANFSEGTTEKVELKALRAEKVTWIARASSFIRSTEDSSRTHGGSAQVLLLVVWL